MEITATAELRIAFSEELGVQASSRILEKIKKHSGPNYQSGVYTAGRFFLVLQGDEELSCLILSLVKNISEWIRDYRIGLRDYYIPNYEISFECDHVGKLDIPHTETVICNGKECKAVFKDIEKDFLKSGGVKRIICLILSKTSGKKWGMVAQPQSPPAQGPNPYEEVESLRLAKKGLTKGEYFYRPRGMKMLLEIKKSVRREFASFGLEEYFPTTYTNFRALEKKGLIEILPPETFFLLASEPIDAAKAYEQYYLKGKVPPIPQKPKGAIYHEIPFNLYHALQKTRIKNPHYLYTLQNSKMLVTFFEKEGNYASAKEAILEKLKSLCNGHGLSFRIISRPLNGEILRFQCLLPHNKTWLTVAEAYFSESHYTRPFKIRGMSGQVNISLENILLSLIGQGLPKKEKLLGPETEIKFHEDPLPEESTDIEDTK